MNKRFLLKFTASILSVLMFLPLCMEVIAVGDVGDTVSAESANEALYLSENGSGQEINDYEDDPRPIDVTAEGFSGEYSVLAEEIIDVETLSELAGAVTDAEIVGAFRILITEGDFEDPDKGVTFTLHGYSEDVSDSDIALCRVEDKGETVDEGVDVLMIAYSVDGSNGDVSFTYPDGGTFVFCKSSFELQVPEVVEVIPEEEKSEPEQIGGPRLSGDVFPQNRSTLLSAKDGNSAQGSDEDKDGISGNAGILTTFVVSGPDLRD
ncbi:MAG: hypothetical protein IKN50_03155, partial [Clostridia bacterium]|nr:hypothetical protein [Clostridia bacterium]